MTYLTQLTEQYYLFQKNPNEDITSNGGLAKYYMSKSPKDFCDAVFVLGIEVRDTDVPIETLYRAINIIKTVYEKHKLIIDKDTSLYVKYSLGLINTHLSVCTIEELTPELVHSDQLPYVIDCIKEALKLLEEIQPVATGVLAHHVTTTYEYAFKCLEQLAVDNDNQPPDLDSVYVFTDQYENTEIWEELIRQLRLKYTYNKENTDELTTRQELALQELNQMLSHWEAELYSEEVVEQDLTEESKEDL